MSSHILFGDDLEAKLEFLTTAQLRLDLKTLGYDNTLECVATCDIVCEVINHDFPHNDEDISVGYLYLTFLKSGVTEDETVKQLRRYTVRPQKSLYKLSGGFTKLIEGIKMNIGHNSFFPGANLIGLKAPKVNELIDISHLNP